MSTPDYRKHAALVDRMASAQGIDLEEAALRGAIDVTGIENAVFACVGCTQPESCGRWLNAHPEGAEAPPHYCRNQELFAELKGLA